MLLPSAPSKTTTSPPSGAARSTTPPACAPSAFLATSSSATARWAGSAGGSPRRPTWPPTSGARPPTDSRTGLSPTCRKTSSNVPVSRRKERKIYICIWNKKVVLWISILNKILSEFVWHTHKANESISSFKAHRIILLLLILLIILSSDYFCYPFIWFFSFSLIHPFCHARSSILPMTLMARNHIWGLSLRSWLHLSLPSLLFLFPQHEWHAWVMFIHVSHHRAVINLFHRITNIMFCW